MKKIILHAVICTVFSTISTGCGKAVDQPQKSNDPAAEKHVSTTTTSDSLTSSNTSGHGCGNHSGSGGTGH